MRGICGQCIIFLLDDVTLKRFIFPSESFFLSTKVISKPLEEKHSICSGIHDTLEEKNDICEELLV